MKNNEGKLEKKAILIDCFYAFEIVCIKKMKSQWLNVKVIGSVAFECSDPESSKTASAKLYLFLGLNTTSSAWPVFSLR